MKAKIFDWLGLGGQERSGDHDHDDPKGHGHTHGVIDATLTTTDRGVWAVKWSFVILAITASLQLVVVFLSGSVALLADTIHNIADATTAIPLWFAFVLARRKPSPTFTYGLGRVEDLAGILIVLIILFSALVAGYQAIDRLIHPQPVTQLGWLTAAGIVGFVGNELVAVFRIRVGRQMNSAALIADGYHARTDGLTSLAVVLGALGVWLGYPIADPIIGLLITITILGIVWQSARAVVTRTLDGVEPTVTAEIRHAAGHVAGATVEVVKARWIGHELHADIAIAVDESTPLGEAKSIARSVKQELLSHMAAVRTVSVTFDSAQGDAVRAPVAADHHAPKPFVFTDEMAQGTLEIVGTPQGERMRMTLVRSAPIVAAVVEIMRPGGVLEVLELDKVGDSDMTFQSTVAPAEPHEFSASLQLATAGRSKTLRFEMAEPAGHSH